jgi:short-subunit dehydrogenase
MQNVKNILITGASSGIGAALAMGYAAPGVTLFLSGRNEKRLLDVARRASAQGAVVQADCVDVIDGAQMAEWIASCDAAKPLDLVIANAGVSDGVHKEGAGANDDRLLFKVNVEGVLNTILPAAPLMKARSRGQIAIMASLAGFCGMPGSAAYCASKAAARVYGEALRGELAPHGVEVNVICPGFVKTPMTDVNTCPMPFLMSPEKAARIIRCGLERNKARISFPWPMCFFVWLFSSAPACLIDLLPIGYKKK